LTEVWFLAEDDGTFALSLNVSRQKVKNLRREKGCSLLLVDPSNPYRYLEVRGDAEVEPDDDYSFAKRVGDKYGADLKSFDGPGETRVKVTIKPARVNAVTMG
jgi:PPOX class probable F420-dependent enzyme